MKKFLADNREKVLILVLVLLSLVKFYQLDGGLVLGEPDEHTHALLTENLKTSPFLQVDEKGWYYGLPLYFYLSYLASFAFPIRFLALRIVSLLASVALTFGIYLFVKEKISKQAAFFSSLIFILSPLSVFYSRLGLIEMTVAALIFLFIFAFDRAWERRGKKPALLAGVFLGCAVLTKYTALPFLVIPILYLLYSTLKLNRGKPLEYLRLDIIPILNLVAAFVIFFPLAFAIYRHEPFFFRQQLQSVLGGQTGFGFYPSYLMPFASWLTLPIAVLAVVGIYFVWAKKEWRLRTFLGYFLFTAYFVFTRDELVPRYFLVLVAFVSIFAGIAYMILFDCLQFKHLSRKSVVSDSYYLRLKMTPWAIISLLLLLTAPKSYEAFRATQHNVLEEVGRFINKRNTGDRWVFSNYWPPQVGYAVGTSKSTWLANCEWETQAFANPPAGKSALDILTEGGGFVVLEEVYSAKLRNPTCRTEAWDFIRQNYQPVKIFTDPSPNFPFASQTHNKIEVYEIK